MAGKYCSSRLQVVKYDLPRQMFAFFDKLVIGLQKTCLFLSFSISGAVLSTTALVFP